MAERPSGDAPDSGDTPDSGDSSRAARDNDAERAEPSTNAEPSTINVDGDADANADAPAATTTKKRPGCLKVGCLSLLAMVVVVALAIGGFALYLNHILDNIDRKSGMLPVNGNPTRLADAGDAQNILLIGTDSREANLQDASRSDVIQLVHLAKGGKSIQIVHFPRDLYVPIPGHGKNKINAAYAFGGPSLLVTTLQNTLGVRIDRVAQIGFPGFAKVTDELGGVDIYVSQAFSEGTANTTDGKSGFGSWTVGWHHMNGAQALGFVRERHQLAQGDIDRGRNQQQWLSAVMSKLLKPEVLVNPIKVTNITKDLTDNHNMILDDGFSSSYLRDTAFSLRNVRRSDITFFTAPFSGFGSDPVAGSIDIVDEAKMKQLGQHLAHDTMSQYTGTPNPIR